LSSPPPLQTNRAFHRLPREGVPVDHPRPDGSIAGDSVRLVDFNTAAVNVWLVVNQFAISDGYHCSATMTLAGRRQARWPVG
jgi:type I restriction enzyme R subunit